MNQSNVVFERVDKAVVINSACARPYDYESLAESDGALAYEEDNRQLFAAVGDDGRCNVESVGVSFIEGYEEEVAKRRSETKGDL